MKKFILISSFVLVGAFMFFSMTGFIEAREPSGASPTGGNGALGSGGSTVGGGSSSIADVCAANSFSLGLSGIVNYATCFLIKTIVPFLFALALAAFIWGVIQFYLNPENEEKRKKGKSFIVGGLIALFVMFSVWGLVGILTETFFKGDNISAPTLPTL